MWYSYTRNNIEYDAVMYMENSNGGKWFHSQLRTEGEMLDQFIEVISRLANMNGVSQKLTEEGTYTFKVVDKAGNVTTKQISVSGLQVLSPPDAVSKSFFYNRCSKRCS